MEVDRRPNAPFWGYKIGKECRMNTIKRIFKADLASVVLPLVVLLGALLLTSKGFFSAYNMYSNLQLIPIYAIVGLSQMTVLSLGQFNLAIGSIGCLSCIMMGYFMQVLLFPVWIALLLGLVIAASLGAFQGLIIAKSGINPFIVTLALLSVYRGIAAVITKGEAFQSLPESFRQLNRIKIGNSIPLTFFISILIGVLVYFIFRYLSIGKKLEACGANPKAAIYSGINLPRTVMIGHALSGALAGIAAILQMAKFSAAQLSVGSDWMLTSFVVAVLGGTLLSGGKVSVLGTFFGSILMVVVNNALVLWKVNAYTFQIFIGLILLIAYEVDRARVLMIRRDSQLMGGAEQGGAVK